MNDDVTVYDMSHPPIGPAQGRKHPRRPNKTKQKYGAEKKKKVSENRAPQAHGVAPLFAVRTGGYGRACTLVFTNEEVRSTRLSRIETPKRCTRETAQHETHSRGATRND